MESKQSVLITGCSDDGIGSGLALIMQQRGYHVFATARNSGRMSKLKDLSNVALLTLDVVDNDHMKAAVESIREQIGGTLDYLINNAGCNHFMPTLDEDLDFTRKLFDNNVWGPLALTQAFAPLLIKARGTVGFITSVAGYVNVPFMGTYGASKRSLELIAETLRLELALFHVSMYKPIEETIAGKARGEDGSSRTDLMEYSTKVIDAITGGTTGKFWCGSNAGTLSFASNYLPTFVLDKGASHGTGLDVLAAQNSH